MNDPAPLIVKEVIAQMRQKLPAPTPVDPTIAALDAEAGRRTRHMPQARLVRDLARQHLTSAFGGPRYDPALLDQLAGHEDVLPGDLGLRKLMAWAVERGIEAPEAFWRAFREEAIMLGLGRA